MPKAHFSQATHQWLHSFEPAAVVCNISISLLLAMQPPCAGWMPLEMGSGLRAYGVGVAFLRTCTTYARSSWTCASVGHAAGS